MSIFDDVRGLLQKIGIVQSQPPVSQVQQNYNEALKHITKSQYVPSPQISAQSPTPPISAPSQPQNTTPMAPINGGGAVNYDTLGQQMVKGLRGQLGGQTPIENYIPQFVEAAKKYPIFQKYPFLLPQIAILESSGGVNVTRANNPLNWGARIQAAGQYSPNSWQQSIDDAITAIGGDYNSRPKGSTRGANADFYQKFRDSGNLKDFVSTYEPANDSYYGNLSKGIEFFNKQK